MIPRLACLPSRCLRSLTLAPLSSLSGIPRCFWALSEFVRHPSASIVFSWFPVLACRRWPERETKEYCLFWMVSLQLYIFIEERQFACRCFLAYSGAKLCCFLLRDETGKNSPKKPGPRVEGTKSTVAKARSVEFEHCSCLKIHSCLYFHSIVIYLSMKSLSARSTTLFWIWNMQIERYKPLSWLKRGFVAHQNVN